jgi:uncharacterized protein (TIGR03118 family)
MKKIRVPYLFGSFGAALAISGLQFLSAMFPCASAQGNPKNFFDWENLQSDIAGVADRTDQNLVNSWGLVINPAAKVFWVADNGSGVSTLYRPDGTPVLLGQSGQNFVTLPPTAVDTGSLPTATPTGIVLNSLSNAFLIPKTTSPAIFIFDGEDGGIWGWNPVVNLLNATLIVKPSTSDPMTNEVYKGLAIANRKSGGATLYATNFRAGAVFVFDSSFNLVSKFTDPNPPAVPDGAAGWGPFGIANINGLLYVTFAAQNAEKHDDVAGAGNGFVDVFTPEGVLLKRLITGGLLNSPWGLARVPEDDHFGKFNDEVLLVGNFGDGQINAYDVRNGTPLQGGPLLHREDQPLQFNGLWALFFFDRKLYFTAGIADEAHGLFGVIHKEEHEDSDD